MRSILADRSLIFAPLGCGLIDVHGQLVADGLDAVRNYCATAM
jgi:hypothetical protein